MDGGKSGVLSLIILIVVLVLTVLTVAQKDRTEDRLKRINETIVKLDEEVKKNIRDVTSMKSGFKSINENMAEARKNLKDGGSETRMLGERISAVLRGLQKLESQSRRLGNTVNALKEEVRTLEVRGTAPSGGKETGGGGEEKPRETTEPGDEKTPDTPPSDVEKKPEEKVTPPVKVKKGLWSRKFPRTGPTQEELGRLWTPDEEGVVRPVIVDYTRDDYDPGRDGGTLKTYLGTDPKGFNPLTENSADVAYLSNYCLSTLCTRLRERPEVWVFDLAEYVDISNDYKTYKFIIRKGVKWQMPLVNLSDPKFAWLKKVDREITSRDFKFAYELIMNPQVQYSHGRLYYQDIERVEAPDRYTFVIHWKRKVYNSVWVSLAFTPIPEFLYACHENGSRFPEESLGLEFNEHWYNNKILSCGQYFFKEWKKGVSLTLQRNPDFHGRRGHFNRIFYLIIRDDDQALLNLKTRDIEYGGLRMSQYKQEVLEKGDTGMFYRRGEDAVANQKIQFDTYLRFGYYYLGYNMENPKFRDPRVREAMTYACPRRKILREIFQDLGEVVTGPIFRYHPYYNKKVKERPYDLDKARELLAEAGWMDTDGNGLLDKVVDGKRIEFEFSLLVYGHSKEYQALATIFKESLRNIGVNLKSEPLDWALMQKKMESREFEAYTGGWALGWEVDPYQLWHSKMADMPKSSNMVGFRNKESDDIIEKGRVTFNDIERAKLFKRFHEILYNEQPYTFLFCLNSIPAWWESVQGVRFSLIRPQNYKGEWYLSE
jgi:ABC-type transport system substrate-binding protein